MVGFLVARRELVLVVGGAAILMLPSMLYGRPFVFWDTPTFYSWGHDILAALRDPWPPLSDFPAHRGLWAADNMPGAWDRITPEQFQLVLTSIGARSKFYAVPLYVLGSTLTLWAVAFAQSLIGAWMLWTTCVTVLPGPRPSAYLCLVAALTVATTAPFFFAFLMPDVFAAFGLLSLALLLCFHDRLTPVRRFGCALLVAAATLVHLSNAAVLGALLVVALAAVRLLLPAVPALRGASTVAVALACAAGLAAASDVGIRAVFGQPVRPPPFVEGRVIADGPGQAFLRDACPTRPFAACRFKDLEVETVEYIIFPDVGDLPHITDPAERKRFLDEQAAVVFGTLAHYPVEQARASLSNAFEQLKMFKITQVFNEPLLGLLRLTATRHSDRTMRVLEIVPNIKVCLPQGRACDDGRFLSVLSRVQFAAVVAALVFLAVRAFRWVLRGRQARQAADGNDRLTLFGLLLVAGVLINAAVCGALAGPYPRYQTRLIWLVPMAAILLADRGPFRMNQGEGRRGASGLVANSGAGCTMGGTGPLFRLY